MKNIILAIFTLFLTINAMSQKQGDTIVVSSFNYSQTYGISQWSPGIRDTVIGFPIDTNLSFEKILMLYNIRCKNNQVSDYDNRNKGCGEWDITCNTYIHDSTRIDSVMKFAKEYVIEDFTGTDFEYSSRPLYNFYRYQKKEVILNNTISENKYKVGAGTDSVASPVSKGIINSKQQYLFTKTELMNAGLAAGELDGISLKALSGSSNTDFLIIGIKHSQKTALSPNNHEVGGFTDVFFNDFNFNVAENKIMFFKPFVWDGVSNIIIEITYSNKKAAEEIKFEGELVQLGKYISSNDDNSLYFDGKNYVIANYKGVSGAKSRTVEAWIKTAKGDEEIVSWGTNAKGKKWVFRVSGTGFLRAETNGASIIGSTILNDNKWYHVACVLYDSTLSSLKLYVNGVEEATTVTNGTNLIDTDSAGLNVRISRGVNDRYFEGNIDEVRIWDTILTESTLKKWMYRSIDNQHQNFSNLQLYYKFDDVGSKAITDHSGNNRNGTVINNIYYNSIKGQDAFKGFRDNTSMPNFTFLQGDYNLSINNSDIYDTITQIGLSAKKYSIVDNSGTNKSDARSLILDTVMWPVGVDNFYDGFDKSFIKSQNVASGGTINIKELKYYTREPMKYEIMSFVTPYGLGLDLGPQGKTWTFDLTDYTPILKGKKRMTIERGGQWMEDMDIKFLFIVGTPPQNVMDIQQLWRVENSAAVYTKINSDRVFEKRTVPINKDGKEFKIRSTITGHGQEGEFIPREHYININEGTKEFAWTVWKDCGGNPIYPQGGTWIYDRAGWCPGMPTDVMHMDITPYVVPGKESIIDYDVETGSGSTKYVVNNQLVTYGAPNFVLDAAVTDISRPTNKIEYSRNNAICNTPSIFIKNTGKTDLTSLVVNYWVNNNTQKSTYTWTGKLKFMESLEIDLPKDSILWASAKQGINKFYVSIDKPNGGNDEYSHNNTYESSFEIPEVMPGEFVIYMKTNSAAKETSYKIINSYGKTMHERRNMSPSTIYKDTMRLGVGCYKLLVIDNDGDGIDFWNNSDGIGKISFQKPNGIPLKDFEGDFGDFLEFNFTIDYPLTYEEIHRNDKSSIFPNPGNGDFIINFDGQVADCVIVTDVLGKVVKTLNIDSVNSNKVKLDLNNQKAGVYIITLKYEARRVQHKIVLQ